ncbi:hypothetical protein PIB30_066189 [Stylosanthes scabra]|uniref:Uncharacterized protein n=1 Tax=Stylosanthes scabra TaxID=79078 RepID=A0ABU6RME7_9FABA|nr:hypothetical protein [Stylosanthes scabra]
MALSSSVSIFDNYRFKTAFNEELYNTIVKNKKVITEVCFDLLDDEYPEICEQIVLRGWKRLAAPKPEISIDLIHEFYANAIISEEEMEEHGGHSYKIFKEQVLADLCMPGATWKLSTGQQRVPIQLRRQELNPIAKISVIRAILIHCIMNCEDVCTEEIIADKMVKMAQGIKEKGKLVCL